MRDVWCPRELQMRPFCGSFYNNGTAPQIPPRSSRVSCIFSNGTAPQGVFANPTSSASPAKLRLAFEAAPFGLLVEQVIILRSKP
mmetsp:Transcript_53442/g.170002  ORF Transcript_53442/g.170002 Transcript_53442/m.170002 type:complete len:85 (+) Transcript_53442:1104-1358(+)